MIKRTLLPGVIAGFAALLAAQTAPVASVDSPAWARHRIVWFGTGETPIKTQLCVGGERVEFDKVTYAGWKKGEPGDVLPLGDRGAMLATFSTLKFDGGELPPGTYLMSLRRAEKGFELLFFEAVAMLRAGERPDRPAAIGPAARAPLRKAKGGRNKSPLTWSLSASKPREPELHLTYGKVGLALRFAIDDLKGTSPFEHEDPRQASCWRISDGEFARIDYGAPAWTSQLKSDYKDLMAGEGWRLGQNWWTTLVNTKQIAIGGKKLPPGVWRLTVAKLGEREFALQVHKATSVTADRIDPAFLGYARIAARIPMAYSEVESSKQLQIAFRPGADVTELTIHYGKHQLAVAVTEG